MSVQVNKRTQGDSGSHCVLTVWGLLPAEGANRGRNVGEGPKERILGQNAKLRILSQNAKLRMVKEALRPVVGPRRGQGEREGSIAGLSVQQNERVVGANDGEKGTGGKGRKGRSACEEEEREKTSSLPHCETRRGVGGSPQEMARRAMQRRIRRGAMAGQRVDGTTQGGQGWEGKSESQV